MTEAKDNELSAAEPSERPAEAAAPGPKPPRSPLPALALLLALLAIAAVAGAAYYFWQELEAVRAERDAFVREAELSERLEPLASRREVEQATAPIGRIEELRGEFSAEADALREELERVGAEQQALGERVARFDQMNAATTADWIRAETAYLTRVAVYRVRYHQDADTALDALKTADRLLSQLGGEAVEERQAIHRAIDALVAVNPPPLGPLVERLSALERQVETMPLELELDRVVLEGASADGGEPAADGWQADVERAWARLKETLGQLVVVQRQRQIEPLMAPEEQYFLHQNLRLRLETARLALVARDAELYRDSLARAVEWMERYYARNEPQVEAALAALEELAAVDISPQMPDIASILEAGRGTP